MTERVMIAIERNREVGDPGEYRRVADLLGGPEVLEFPVTTPLDAHHAIRKGLSGRALHSLVANLRVLKPTDIEEAIGMSVRTFQRKKEVPEKPLSPDQGGRIWKLAEILAQATEIFGSQEEAEHWLERPALGLDNNRPIDLLSTPAGVEMVEEHLGRVAYGVYT